MPGQRHGFRLAFQGAVLLAVGRIAHHGVKFLVAERFRGLTQIHGVDVNPIGKAVQFHRTPGHVRHIGLQLDGFKLGIGLLMTQQQRQNARTCAQIGYAFPGPDTGEIC